MHPNRAGQRRREPSPEPERGNRDRREPPIVLDLNHVWMSRRGQLHRRAPRRNRGQSMRRPR